MMNVKKHIGVAVMVCVTGVAGAWTLGAAEEQKNVEQMITEAKTTADHEAIAAYYEKEAQEAHQKHAEHQQYSKSYSTIPVLKTKTGAVAHCDSIAKKYESIAKEYEALAKLHKGMAKSAK
jgi:hypothetical protein